ncbi:uncharacterized protein [Parasteatoda tepidariorum]|nr:uncharacterized protein LOC107457322 [Parasteatoda tepidariorum]
MLHQRSTLKFVQLLLILALITHCKAVENRSVILISTTLRENLSEVQDISNTIDSETNDDSCNDATLHKCGSSLVGVFRLLNYIPWEKSFETKCALRKNFFACMKKESTPCKKNHWRLNQPGFRKKLARSLWATRGCVLGIKSAMNTHF